MKVLIGIAIIIPIVIAYVVYRNLNPGMPAACDMSRAKNRDFNNYYGVSTTQNYFSKHSADDCTSNVAFTLVLPQPVLKPDHSASSFMILSKYGTGKTLLRCEYFNRLNTSNYFPVLILNSQVNEYLERFVSGSSNGKDCTSDDCLMNWSKTEFTQMILSILVTQFIDNFYKKPFALPNIALDEKIQLIHILCFYYNGIGVIKLERFINIFLNKTDSNSYSLTGTNLQHQKSINDDETLLKSFIKDLKRFTTFRQDEHKLELLALIAKGEDFQSQLSEKLMYDNIINDLTHFTLFMKKHVKKPVVFIVDGIDENRYFFVKHRVNKKSFELFCRSALSQEIHGILMAQNFYLSLFYPDIDGINIRDAIIRIDKFPVYEIKWDTTSLINYADYFLQKMSDHASTTRCKPFANFTTLVNYENPLIAERLTEITTPRALNYFMNALIIQLNNCANNAKIPFIATYENVKAALEEVKKHSFTHYQLP